MHVFRFKYLIKISILLLLMVNLRLVNLGSPFFYIFPSIIVSTNEMRAADCKYSELRTSRCHGDASLHHNHREDGDQDQKVMETVLIQEKGVAKV